MQGVTLLRDPDPLVSHDTISRHPRHVGEPGCVTAVALTPVASIRSRCCLVGLTSDVPLDGGWLSWSRLGGTLREGRPHTNGAFFTFLH